MSMNEYIVKLKHFQVFKELTFIEPKRWQLFRFKINTIQLHGLPVFMFGKSGKQT